MAVQTAAQVRGRRRTRLSAAVGATAAAIGVWVVAAGVLGKDLEVEQGNTVSTVTLPHVFVGAFVASMAAWGALAVLERVTQRAATIWRYGAAGVLVLSLGGPLTAGVDASTVLTLSLMHLVVGLTLLSTLARSTR